MSEPTAPVTPAEDTVEIPDAPSPFDPAAPVETSGKASQRAEDGPGSDPDDDEGHPAAGALIDPDAPADPAFHGPYDPDEFGMTSDGSPLNAYGRSAAMNNVRESEAVDGD